MLEGRENVLSLYRKHGYGKAPAGMVLVPSQEEEFKRRYPDQESYQGYFGFPYRIIVDPGFGWAFDNKTLIPDRDVDWHSFYSEGF